MFKRMFRNNFEKVLFTVLAIVGVMLTIHISDAMAVDGFDPATCPDGPFDPAVWTAYCPLPEGQSGLCYDNITNSDCTPLPPDDPDNDVFEMCDGRQWNDPSFKCVDIGTMIDFRYFHDSAAQADVMAGPGGFKIAVEFFGGDPGDVEVKTTNETTSMTVNLVQDQYLYLGDTIWSYDLWLGSEAQAAGGWSVFINDVFYTVVDFNMLQPRVPVIALHKMKKQADGSIQLKFSAPAIDGFENIRVRVIEREPVYNMLTNFKVYDISKAVHFTLEPQYSGKELRLEYRVEGGVRTTLYLTLP